MKLKKKKKNPNGFILWEGKSPINKALDIALIVTGFEKKINFPKNTSFDKKLRLFNSLYQTCKVRETNKNKSKTNHDKQTT